MNGWKKSSIWENYLAQQVRTQKQILNSETTILGPLFFTSFFFRWIIHCFYAVLDRFLFWMQTWKKARKSQKKIKFYLRPYEWPQTLTTVAVGLKFSATAVGFGLWSTLLLCKWGIFLTKTTKLLLRPPNTSSWSKMWNSLQ